MRPLLSLSKCSAVLLNTAILVLSTCTGPPCSRQEYQHLTWPLEHNHVHSITWHVSAKGCKALWCYGCRGQHKPIPSQKAMICTLQILAKEVFQQQERTR